MKRSIVDGGNGEKKLLSLVRNKLALKDEKRKTMRTQILVNKGYCIRNIKFFIFISYKSPHFILSDVFSIFISPPKIPEQCIKN